MHEWRLIRLGRTQMRLIVLASAIGVAITATYAGQGFLVAVVIEGDGREGIAPAAGAPCHPSSRRGVAKAWRSTPQSAAQRTSGIRFRRPQPSTIHTGATDGTTVAINRVQTRKPTRENTP